MKANGCLQAISYLLAFQTENGAKLFTLDKSDDII
jgi:hypothetical protein